MSYLDLGKDGPMVVEAPVGLQGILLDFWQRPTPVDGGKFAGDVGLPGPDGGKGDKFLIVPPGYKGKVPEAISCTARARTTSSCSCARSTGIPRTSRPRSR